MADLFKTRSSQGVITVTETLVKIRLPGVGERSIARSAITDVSISLGFFYFAGFFRNLTIHAQGDVKPIRLTNMRKSKALEMKELLGF